MKNLNTVLKEVAVEGKVRFPVNETEALRDTSVDVLSLDTRCSNGLKRNHIHTIGDLLDNIVSGGLTQIHSLGRKSENRIMYELCAYQYNLLTKQSSRNRFLRRIVELNTVQN